MEDWQITFRIILRWLFVAFVATAVLCIVWCFIKDVFLTNKGKMKGKITTGRFR